VLGLSYWASGGYRAALIGRWSCPLRHVRVGHIGHIGHIL
jgi:hypothetical protein